MSRQSLLENYYKIQSSTPKTSQSLVRNMSDKKGKRRKLSLNKTTPKKMPKWNAENSVSDVISLISDDEDTVADLHVSHLNLSQNSAASETSDLSQKTVIYTPPQSPVRLLQTVKMETATTESLVKSPKSSDRPQCSKFKSSPVLNTPQKSSTPDSHSSKFKTLPSFNTPQKCSPKSSQSSANRTTPKLERFFSPTKHRNVVKRSPGKVKRSLSTEMAYLAERAENETFSVACEGMDDKTKFLLTIINQFLKEPSLVRLLDDICQGLLANCLRVMKPGMKLVCRLYWRKEKWYKLDQLKSIVEEKEPDDVDSNRPIEMNEMIKSLIENSLLVEGDLSQLAFEDFTSILTKDELKQICKELKLKHADNKLDAITALDKYSKQTTNITKYLSGCTSSNEVRVKKMMNSKVSPLYKLSDLARSTIYKLYVIMYLGMDFNIIREKNLEYRLLCDKTKRETFPVDKDMELDNASVVFRDKVDFDRYMIAHLKYEDFISRTDVPERCEIVRQVYSLLEKIDGDEMARYKSFPPWLRRYTPPYIYIKILETGIEDLKKSKLEVNYRFAVEVLSTLISQNSFRVHRKARWYNEKALLLHINIGLYDQAAEVLIEGLKSDLSEEDKDVMRPRARRLANQKNINLSEHLKYELLELATKENKLENNLNAQHIYKQPMDRTNKRGKVKFEMRTPEGRSFHEAEEYCVVHYISSGQYTHGDHWEGRIVTTIYFLLFWDIIYSKPKNVKGIFLSYYQEYPLDMFTESFYENRKTRIEQWLDYIRNASMDKLLKIMRETWMSRPQCELSGINRNIKLEDIEMVSSCLGPSGLAAICRRLAINYYYAHSGFPDLTIWNVVTRKIKFVEVKTDSDKPSMKQIQWMHYLREHNIDTEFCYLGANTTRQRCRNTKKQTTLEYLSRLSPKLELTLD